MTGPLDAKVAVVDGTGQGSAVDLRAGGEARFATCDVTDRTPEAQGRAVSPDPGRYGLELESPGVSSAQGAPGQAGRNGSRVHDGLVNVLGRQILGGTYRPGEMLPREEELCDLHGVSRTSLREAVKVLSAKGLIEARRRVGVRVRPREDWSLLDPAVLRWHPGIQHDEELMAGLIEARRIFEPAAAELAARRASAADVADIEHAFEAMTASVPDHFNNYCRADLAFHRGIIAASHNVVLRGLAGLMEAALTASFTITNTFMERQARALAVHGRVLDAIRLRDTAGARAAMGRLLDLAAEDLHLV